MTAPTPIVGTLDTDFATVRNLTAARTRVFQAWTDARQLSEWWRIDGVVTAVCQIDPRPRGQLRIVMRGPDGVEYTITGVYLDVVPLRQLIANIDLSEYPQRWHDRVNPFRDRSVRPRLVHLQIVTLDDAGAGRTTVTVLNRFESKAIRDAMQKVGLEQEWARRLDRLALHLSAISDSPVAR